ncbi:SRPBCC family protein [Rubrolithibacter danxiaensis]|uniref:SRPBCC family protein n=1 Tax=Rubrolithibacter danxiaensis TaxID=3390805 RepID=UPI003BF79BD6
MESENKKTITVENTVNAPVARVWKLWNEPEHIQNWCHASNDWHAPYAENDLKINGTFKTTMAAKDNSFSFDFGGVYTNIKENQLIEYTIDDGRKVAIRFIDEGNQTKVIETFEMESLHPEEMQRSGWQAIMDNFKNYAESIA